MQRTSRVIALLIATTLSLTTLEPARAGDTDLVVTDAGDGPDVATDGTCATAAGTCTLRAALTEANARTGHDLVRFGLPGAGPHTISPATTLPTLTDPFGVTIDGRTQAGATVNTSATGFDAVIQVQLRGTGPTAIDGLVMTGGANEVRGLALHDFRRAVWLLGTAASGNVVAGNIIGTDVTATFVAPAAVPGADGVTLQGGAQGNRVGGADLAERNLISGTAHHGVNLLNVGTSSNLVVGNVIGLDRTGISRVPNRSHGVDLNTGATYNRIGGLSPGESNVISGNDGEGVEHSHNPSTVGNRILGNLIGTDGTGTAATAATRNLEHGVRLEGAERCAASCPPDAGYAEVRGNTIVGSNKGGILIDKGSHHNVVADNRIGVLADGTAIGNTFYAIRIEHGAEDNVVGPGNVIAGNPNAIQIVSTGSQPTDPSTPRTWGNTVTRNSIYGNGGPGIDLEPLYQVNPNDGEDADTGANEQLNVPVLSSISPTTISGTACSGCVVEAFASDRPVGAAGPGVAFFLDATAGQDGRFALPTPPAAWGQRVTLTARSPAGSTSEFSPNVQVPTPPVVASDAFQRGIPAAWGTADVGGAWTLAGGVPADRSTDGAGRARVAPGASARAGLAVSVTDVDAVVRLATDRRPTGFGAVGSVSARQVAALREYRVGIRVGSDGGIRLRVVKLQGTFSEVLISEVTLPLAVSGGAPVLLRVQVAGRAPTSLRARAWLPGTPEPSTWALAASDADPALQAAGGVGIVWYLSGSAATGPLDTFSDDLVIRDVR